MMQRTCLGMLLFVSLHAALAPAWQPAAAVIDQALPAITEQATALHQLTDRYNNGYAVIAANADKIGKMVGLMHYFTLEQQRIALYQREISHLLGRIEAGFAVPEFAALLDYIRRSGSDRWAMVPSPSKQAINQPAIVQRIKTIMNDTAVGTARASRIRNRFDEIFKRTFSGSQALLPQLELLQQALQGRCP
ncbi:hypothetical protein M1466_01135 [Candidatus Dependentiae bacterium]|nr:hypothetical protein [Candidatus Dependentiae bacterium]